MRKVNEEVLIKQIAQLKENLNSLNNKLSISNTVAESYRDRLVSRTTPAESVIKFKLKNLKINYEFQKIIYGEYNLYYIVDFYLPEYNTIIEIDGYYHEETKQKVKDNRRSNILRSLGYNKILRLDNIKANNINEKDLLKLIKQLKGINSENKIQKKIIKYKSRIHQLEQVLGNIITNNK